MTMTSQSSATTPKGAVASEARAQTLASFDWQWAHVPSGDLMPGDPWFDRHAIEICSRDLCAIAPEWFAGKQVLDAGCGQGRWTRALLELGAEVTAVDFSEVGLRRTRELCGDSLALQTIQVDLLSPPAELRERRFDLVFSFGVLHHTGDTWAALDKLARLVAEEGAIFLYLYGADSWSPEHEREIEELRRALAPMTFDTKLAELQRRYPGDDPHQMFDLMSPTINDRVHFADVAGRLGAHGIGEATQTLASNEIYLRAVREGFPRGALLEPRGEHGLLAHEVSRRSMIRRGVGFERALRAALEGVQRRPVPPRVAEALHRVAAAGGRIIDASLPPDGVPDGRFDVRRPSAERFLLADVSPAQADLVLHLGGGLGASRFPRELLGGLWSAVGGNGTLIVELPARSSGTRRTFLDRVRDRRKPVPAKVRAMLDRHPFWTSGDALQAVGGDVLSNPLDADEAIGLLRGFGAAGVDRDTGRAGCELLVATRGA